MEPGLNDFRKSQPYRLQKKPKIRRSTVRQACSGEKAKAVCEQSFASAWDEIQSHRGLIEGIKDMTHGFCQLSHWPIQEEEKEAFCLMQGISVTYTRDSQGS